MSEENKNVVSEAELDGLEQAVNPDADYFSDPPVPVEGNWRFRFALGKKDPVLVKWRRDYKGEKEADGSVPFLLDGNGRKIAAIHLALECTGLDPEVEKQKFFPRMHSIPMDQSGKSELVSMLANGFRQRLTGNIARDKQLIEETFAAEPEALVTVQWQADVPWSEIKDLDQETQKKVRAACPKGMRNFPPDGKGGYLQEVEVTVDNVTYTAKAQVVIKKIKPSGA